MRLAALTRPGTASFAHHGWRSCQAWVVGSGVASTPKSGTRVFRERRSFQNVAGLGIAEAQHPPTWTPHVGDERAATKELRHALTHVVNAMSLDHRAVFRQVRFARMLAFPRRRLDQHLLEVAQRARRQLVR